jgi:hypothetical protein
MRISNFLGEGLITCGMFLIGPDVSRALQSCLHKAGGFCTKPDDNLRTRDIFGIKADRGIRRA